MSVRRPGGRPAVVALDVGGTAIKGAVLDEGGIILERTSPTNAAAGPQTALEAVIDALVTLISDTPATHKVAGVGLAVPGTVDEDEGIVVSAENLGWVDLPITHIASEAVGLPVAFGHDVRTAGLAEWHIGAGADARNLAYISIGTGIAAALVMGGRLVVQQGWAGEIGHGGALGGAPCACGGRGCAETFASAAGIARRYLELTGIEVPGSKEVLAAAKAGDSVAQEVWRAAIDRLGELIAQIVRVTGLGTVVVGGGLVRAGDDLMVPLTQMTNAYLTIHRKPELMVARLGSAAGTYGAALLGWRAAGLKESPTWAAPQQQEDCA